MLELTRNWAATEPMVLFLDDLQWSDPASVELVIHLLQLVSQCRILFVCATRIERESPGWQVASAARERFAQHYTEIWLHPLSQSDSEHLMNQVAGQASLSSTVRQQIERKAEGNPLYVEELVLSILGTGEATDHAGLESITKDDRIEIPDTLQALLLSRWTGWMMARATRLSRLPSSATSSEGTCSPSFPSQRLTCRITC